MLAGKLVFAHCPGPLTGDSLVTLKLNLSLEFSFFVAAGVTKEQGSTGRSSLAVLGGLNMIWVIQFKEMEFVFSGPRFLGTAEAKASDLPVVFQL